MKKDTAHQMVTPIPQPPGRIWLIAPAVMVAWRLLTAMSAAPPAGHSGGDTLNEGAAGSDAQGGIGGGSVNGHVDQDPSARWPRTGGPGVDR